MPTTTTPARWYPDMPPRQDGEDDDAYTNRLLGVGGEYPFDHKRGRQCSIGYHNECSNRSNAPHVPGVTDVCECPHHEEVRNAVRLVAEWNAAHPIGTQVTIPSDPLEPPTASSGPAEVVRREGLNWPMVPLEGFDHPVQMSWLAVA